MLILAFQSLFWWKRPSDLAKAGLQLKRSFCFNPCFGGSGPQTFSLYKFEKRTILFQSLFWWKRPSDNSARKRERRPKISFNPCYGGSGPQTIVREKRKEAKKKFQSLFWWKRPSDGSIEIEPTSSNRVSILVLVEAALRHCAGDDLEVLFEMFQSLFWWKRPSDLLI